jgi:raffinose/stachyose/melibiose transport system substrate-binding protein
LTTGALVNSSDKDFIDKMNKNEGSYQQLAKMFDIIDMVNSNTNSNGLEIGGSDGCAEFATGNYGMWVQGPWFSQTILEANPDFNLGVAPLPVSNDSSQTMINASVSTSLAVSSFSQNKEVAKALVAYFLDPEKSSEFYQAVQFNPLSTVHNFQTSPWIDEATVYSAEGKAYVDPSIPGAVKDESGKMLQAYYTGDASQNDVIDALDTAWQTYNEVNQ